MQLENNKSNTLAIFQQRSGRLAKSRYLLRKSREKSLVVSGAINLHFFTCHMCISNNSSAIYPQLWVRLGRSRSQLICALTPKRSEVYISHRWTNSHMGARYMWTLKNNVLAIAMTTNGPIVFDFGTPLDTRQLSGFHVSRLENGTHLHVSRCHEDTKVLLISFFTRPFVCRPKGVLC